jgi:tetratricopeptide (TPR) repeat protein
MLPGLGRVVADPDSPLELQIQMHIIAGNWAFFQSKYSLALSEYLAAWGLLPKIVFPHFSIISLNLFDTLLLSVDMSKQLMEASAQILQFRDSSNNSVHITPSVDPPDQLVKISEKYCGVFDKGSQLYQRGLAYAKIGEVESAVNYLRQALNAGSLDRELQADVRASLGALELGQGNYDSARKELLVAMRFYQETNKTDGMAAMQYNIGVTSTFAGDIKDASEYFTKAAVNAPASLKWQVTHTFNPGIASVTRPMGKVGLPLLLKNSEGKWIETPASIVTERKRNSTIIINGTAVQIDLRNEGAVSIETQLLKTRVNAKTLVALETYFLDLTQFVSYLAHIQGFVLPLALGDTYFALGDYEKAATYYIKVRDYPYLNLSIERPMVWYKLARTYLQMGNRLYRDRDMAGARTQYEHILLIRDNSYDFSGPLYSGGFAPLKEETLAFLDAPNRLLHNAMDYSRRIIILEALSNLNQISNGINYLGFPEDIVPIHSWRYLQNTARYFANQAIQAERAYISFKNSAEQEEFTRLSLEQAEAAQSAALNVEEKRKSAVEEQKKAAEESYKLVQTRLANAVEQWTDYANTSAQLANYDEIIAFTNASDRKVDIIDWATTLGINLPKVDTPFGELTLSVMKGANLVQLLTRKRSKVTRQYELRNMARTIAELGGVDQYGAPILDENGQPISSQLSVAQKQVDVAKKMVDVATAQRDLAWLRLEQAQAQTQFFNSQEFTPELWDNLALAQREISLRYLDWAIGAAFLMERAFEFEYDTDVNRIRFDYARSELHGLLAADFLLADVDQFSYDRLLETEKQLPVKVVISLADQYPYLFYQQFQKTGRIDFQTFLGDFDKCNPGAHLCKLRKVEVVIEGLIGPRGIHGTLTNSGISFYRDHNGKRQIRMQKPETMILSRYDMRRDGFVFTAEEDVLAVFENSGIASGWILEIPPESNDIDFRGITNIHLILYFDAYYNENVANMVRAELAAEEVSEYSLGLGLRFQYPDEFFSFQDTGTVTFDINNIYLPYDHTNSRIRDIYLIIETENGISPAGLVINVATAEGGININQTTDLKGMISTDTAVAPLNTLRDQLLTDTWTIRIDKVANAAAFSTNFTWEKVHNIFLFIEYAYEPRGRPISIDDFSNNPLSNFDVIDDPLAVNAAPSNWVYDATHKRIEQISNIHAPAGAANLNVNPDKPGTYLIRKSSADWPELCDLVLHCHVNSGETDGIGIIFRYQDVNNFYFFLMDAQRNYRRIGKKVEGVFQDLKETAVDTANGYTVNNDYEITVACVGNAFKVYLDQQEILSGRDPSLSNAGLVGFYAWGNAAARFLDLKVQPI